MGVVRGWGVLITLLYIFPNVEGDVRDGATERARLGIFRSNKPRSLKIVLGFPMGKCGGAAQIQ